MKLPCGHRTRQRPATQHRSVEPTIQSLRVTEEAVVRSVGADPEPGDLVVLHQSEGAVAPGYAGGVDRIVLVDLLELEAWVVGIFPEELVRLSSCILDLRREVAIRRPEARRRARFHSLSGSSSVALPAARSARASAASLLRVSCELVNCRAHRSSSSNSSSNQRAMRSCSSGGSPASFAMAASSARIISSSIRLGGDALERYLREQPTRVSQSRIKRLRGPAVLTGGRNTSEGGLAVPLVFCVTAQNRRVTPP
jgi:hypothetical protein